MIRIRSPIAVAEEPIGADLVVIRCKLPHLPGCRANRDWILESLGFEDPVLADEGHRRAVKRERRQVSIGSGRRATVEHPVDEVESSQTHNLRTHECRSNCRAMTLALDTGSPIHNREAPLRISPAMKSRDSRFNTTRIIQTYTPGRLWSGALCLLWTVCLPLQRSYWASPDGGIRRACRGDSDDREPSVAARTSGNDARRPPRCAPTGRWFEPIRSEIASSEQPRNHRIRVPHLAGPQLVAAPGHRRHGRHEIEEPTGRPPIGAQPLRTSLRLVGIRNDTIRPASHLVSERPDPR